MLNDILDLIRRRQGQNVDPGFALPDVNPNIDPGFAIKGDGRGLDPGFALNPGEAPLPNRGFAPAQFLTQRPDNLLPGLGAVPPGLDKPSAGLGGAGVALPPPQAGVPLPGAMPAPMPGLPPMGGTPFQQKMIDVSPWGSRAVMREANNRDDELMALAERAGARASANAMGTGYMPDGHMLDPRLGMNAAQNASGDFLRSASAADDAAMRERLGLQQIQGQRDIADIGAKSRLEEQRLQNEGLIGAARERAMHEHAMGLNKATLDMIGGLSTNPNLDPKAIKAAMDFLNSQRQGATGGALPPGVSTDKGAGGPAATGGAAQDPLAAILDVNRGNQVVDQYKSLFAGEGGKTTITPDAVNNLLDRLSTSGPQDRAALVDAIQSGKFGDPLAMQDAILKATAIAHFRTAPPTDPRTGKPVNFSNESATSISPYSVNGPDGNPLFTYRVGGLGIGGATIKPFLAGGVPYNQVGANGRWLDVSPTDLRPPTAFGYGIGQQTPQEVLQGRAYHGSDLTRELIARSKARGK